MPSTLPMTSGVYCIRNLASGKAYVGSTSNLSRRWTREHLRLLRRGVHQNKHLQSSWKKYGEPAFVFDVLAETEPKDLLETEQAFLSAFEGSGLLYNTEMRAGKPPRKKAGTPHTEQAKAKMRASHAGLDKRTFLGKRHTEDAKAKMRVHKLSKNEYCKNNLHEMTAGNIRTVVGERRCIACLREYDRWYKRGQRMARKARGN